MAQKSDKTPYFLRKRKSLTEEKSSAVNKRVRKTSQNLVDRVLSQKDTGEKILKLLPGRDLCNVALVSERMHILASDPTLWNGFTLNQNKVKKRGLTGYFGDCKLIRFKSLVLCTKGYDDVKAKVSKNDCQALLDHLKTPDNKIDEVDFSNCNLYDIPPALLSQTVTRLTKVSFGLCFPSMTFEQILQILRDIGNSETLKDVQLSIPLWKMGKDLSTHQLVQALEMCKEAKAIKELYIGQGCILKQVPAALLAEVVAKMRTLKIEYIQGWNKEYLTPEQTKAIFDKAAQSTSLVELDIGNAYSNIKVASPGSLAKTMAKLKTAKLSHFTAEQLAAVLDELAIKNNLEKLTLVNNDMTLVDMEKLKIVISKNVRFVKINDYSDQIIPNVDIGIFEGLSVNTSLMELDLSEFDISSVPIDHLLLTVSRLQKLSFSSVHVSDDQLIAICQGLAESDSLKTLNIMQMDLTVVPVHLLHRISGRLGKEKLLIRGSCHLTEEQSAVEFTDEDKFCFLSMGTV